MATRAVYKKTSKRKLRYLIIRTPALRRIANFSLGISLFYDSQVPKVLFRVREAHEARGYAVDESATSIFFSNACISHFMNLRR